MSQCRKCQTERQPWHPGEPFKCEALEYCPVCQDELRKLEARKAAVIASPLAAYLYNARLLPFLHQVIGIEALVKWSDESVGRIIGGAFFIADEMGAGKTKQVIDAAQALYHLGCIDRLVIVCPASVRDVWTDPQLGEFKKHLWANTPALVTEYHSNQRQWSTDNDKTGRRLRCVVTNYDYVRSKRVGKRIQPSEHMQLLMKLCNAKTWVVFDEASALNNTSALQSKGALALRRVCGRVTVMNGTPVGQNQENLFGQCFVLDWRILGSESKFHFRSRYAVLGGYMQKQVIGWLHPKQPSCCEAPPTAAVHRCLPGQGLEEVQQKLAPYILRRLKKDCLDLPEKLPAVTLTVPLTTATWNLYTSMRDELVAWLSEASISEAAHAMTKVIRLSQLTSGFIGGVVDEEDPQTVLNFTDTAVVIKTVTREVGREKLDFFLAWLKERLDEDPAFKVLVWCRFRPELDRLMLELRQRFSITLGSIHGGQSREERSESLQLLDPRMAPSGPVLVASTTGSGSLGLNLTAANVAVRLSHTYSLLKLLQGEDRLHRPGQTQPVSYYDVVAVGPKGQRTIDHVIISTLRQHDSFAKWTASAWVTALKQDESSHHPQINL